MSKSLISMGCDVDGTGVHEVTLPSIHDDPGVVTMIIGPSGVHASGIVFPGVDVGVSVDGAEEEEAAGR